MRIRDAVPADAPRVTALLAEAGLPLDGVPPDLNHFTVAEREGEIVGVAGIELYGDAALLRSTAVDRRHRKAGVGGCLVEAALARARAAGARDIYLLTTTAADYFPRFGFSCVGREAVPGRVMASPEFQGVCPDSAVAMHKRCV